jgi:hypothetical protein
MLIYSAFPCGAGGLGLNQWHTPLIHGARRRPVLRRRELKNPSDRTVQHVLTSTGAGVIAVGPTRAMQGQQPVTSYYAAPASATPY